MDLKGYKENEEYIVDMQILVNRVQELHYDYFNKNHEQPRFIKMPYWLFCLLREQSERVIGVELDSKGEHTYMGMKICPTKSIINAEDIEVF